MAARPPPAHNAAMRFPSIRPSIRSTALLFALLVVPAARADTFVEPSTEESFEAVQKVGGRTFLLLGAGARKPPAPAAYAIALWVEQEMAHRAFPALAAKVKGRTRDKLVGGDRSPTFVVWGDFEKIGELRFKEATSAETLRAAFEEGLSPLLADKVPADLKDRVRAFLALFDRDLSPGDSIRIHTSPGGAIELEIAGSKKEVPTDARLQRGIWEIWLGGKPVSNELRRALIDRIEILGK